MPLFQNESKRETFHMKISFAHKFIQMQIKLICYPPPPPPPRPSLNINNVYSLYLCDGSNKIKFESLNAVGTIVSI